MTTPALALHNVAMKRSPLLLLVGGFSLLPLLPSTGAEETASAAQSAMTLDQALALNAKLDEDLRKRLEVLRTLLDKEVAAERVNGVAANSLRLALKSASASLNADFNTVFSYLRSPVENAALQAELGSLETDWTAAQTQRVAALKAANNELRNSLATALRKADKPNDLDGLIASANRLQEMTPSRPAQALVGTLFNANTANQLPTFLRAFRQLLEAQERSEAIGAALNQFQNAANNLRPLVEEGDVQKRIQRTTEPFQKAQDDAQDALDRALRGGKPAAEVAAALAKLEESVERSQQVRANFNSRNLRDAGNALNTYRNLAALVSSLEAGQFSQARNTLNNVRGSGLHALGAMKSAAFQPQVQAWEKVIDEGIRKGAAKWREEAEKKLAAIKKPAELEALAAEIQKAENEARDGRDLEFPRGLGGQLSALAAAWNSGTVAGLARFAYGGPESNLGLLSDLRKRIERDVIAKALEVPELNQPPLNELPTEDALEKLSDQLAQKSEWRRLLQIMEGRAAQPRYEGVIMGANDLVAALRAFLAAQNFESAELWPDAVLSYKSVLRSNSTRAPIKEAAQRLKDLRAKHPEAFTTTVPAAADHFPR